MDFLQDRRAKAQARLLRSLCVVNPADRDEESAARENKLTVTLDDLALDPLYRRLGQIIFQWVSKYIGPPVISELQTILEQDRDLQLLDCLKEVREQPFAYPTVFTHVLDGFRKDTATQTINKAIKVTSSILSEDGFETFSKGKQLNLRGPEQALEYLTSELSAVRGVLNPQFKDRTMEELRLSLEAQYQMKKIHGMEPRIYTGLENIDLNTNGGKAGELWSLAGFVGHGKTTLAINWVYRALADNAQSTAMYISLEMPEEQLFNILCTRHNYELSRLEGFKPLAYSTFRDKFTTSDEDEEIYHYTLESFSRNFNERLEIIRPREAMCIGNIRDRAEASHRRLGGLDMLVIDYLGLLTADPSLPHAPKSRFEQINSNFILAKRLSMEFARGEGIFVLTPHQINRKGYKGAQEATAGNGGGLGALTQLRGRYDVDALADANECERSSDVVFSIYQDDAYFAESRAVMCCLKNRDGKKPEPWMVEYYNQYRFIQQINAERERGYESDFLTS